MVSLSSNILVIKAPQIAREVIVGDSVAVNGVCLTVTELKNSFLAFYLSDITSARSGFTNRSLFSGMCVNLEQAMRADRRFGGHFVTGHVDSTMRIIDLYRNGEVYYCMITLEPAIGRYIAAKGSIAIDGVSLTVSDRLSSSFRVAIIPHTFSHTIFQYKRIGDQVNIEVDIIARYCIDGAKSKEDSYEKCY